MAELKRTSYSGVIVDRQHTALVNRLQRKGFTDRFRQIPTVAVWALNTEMLAQAQ